MKLNKIIPLLLVNIFLQADDFSLKEWDTLSKIEKEETIKGVYRLYMKKAEEKEEATSKLQIMMADFTKRKMEALMSKEKVSIVFNEDTLFDLENRVQYVLNLETNDIEQLSNVVIKDNLEEYSIIIAYDNASGYIKIENNEGRMALMSIPEDKILDIKQLQEQLQFMKPELGQKLQELINSFTPKPSEFAEPERI